MRKTRSPHDKPNVYRLGFRATNGVLGNPKGNDQEHRDWLRDQIWRRHGAALDKILDDAEPTNSADQEHRDWLLAKLWPHHHRAVQNILAGTNPADREHREWFRQRHAEEAAKAANIPSRLEP
jgi:hypothetical protein